MLFFSKCPLRISLIGGSTDLEPFIEKYGRGSVISFPSNLHVYVSVHENNRDKFILNYSKNEEVDSIEKIENKPAKIVLKYFDTEPVTVSFLSDIVSTGSGLGSSSAYFNALIKAVSSYKKNILTEFETCKLAIELERKFNPETGYQDSYGCGIGGLKRIDFIKNKNPSFRYLNAEFLRKNFDMALYYTGITRNSGEILKTVNPEKSLNLLDKVNQMEKTIEDDDKEAFLKVFNEGWEIKKTTSPMIVDNKAFRKWDEEFKKEKSVYGIKLAGAGGGGYFLAFCKKGQIPSKINGMKPVPIFINETGVVAQRL